MTNILLDFGETVLDFRHLRVGEGRTNHAWWDTFGSTFQEVTNQSPYLWISRKGTPKGRSRFRYTRTDTV